MKMRAENERQRSVNDFCGLRIFGDWQKIGRAVFFGGIDGLSPACDRHLQLKWELKMSVNGASMIFVDCVYLAIGKNLEGLSFSVVSMAYHQHVIAICN
jgi:hypothetical protein